MEIEMKTHKAYLAILIQVLLLATSMTSYASSNQMRRVVLEEHLVKGVNLLTQDMLPIKTGKNTIYVINSHYVLEKTVTIPEGSVLSFNGGSIIGKGTLVGQGTYVKGDLLNVFGVDVTFAGKWHFKSISPDWFVGTDVEKVQRAFDVSVANGSTQIDIDRTYNLTGGTIYVDRGSHSKDEISPWSRRNLIVCGSGEGRLIKEDSGYMFSAHSLSIDFEFDRLHFRGYIKDPKNLNSIVDMRVFDCRYLGNVRVSNSTFCHCGCIYYQTGGAATPMQGVLSINNQYMKNKSVMKANECWHSQFISDAIEDGIVFVEGEGIGSNIRDLKITNSCIEGFYHSNTAAINLNCNAPSLSVTDNYFEANYCSMRMLRYVSGIITGNAFHSRGAFIKKDEELHCIELASVENLEITANNVVVDDKSMYMFYFDTTSPYCGESQVVYGNNSVAGKTILSNLEGKVKKLNSALRAVEKNYINDITSNMKKVFPQIRGGKILISNSRGMTTISLINLEVSRSITSGAFSGSCSVAKPFDSSLTVNGALVDKDKNLMGVIYVTSEGNIGLRMKEAGTYNGVITYPHE